MDRVCLVAVVRREIREDLDERPGVAVVDDRTLRRRFGFAEVRGLNIGDVGETLEARLEAGDHGRIRVGSKPEVYGVNQHAPGRSTTSVFPMPRLHDAVQSAPGMGRFGAPLQSSQSTWTGPLTVLLEQRSSGSRCDQGHAPRDTTGCVIALALCYSPQVPALYTVRKLLPE